jgi:hypothetical protein
MMHPGEKMVLNLVVEAPVKEAKPGAAQIG